MPSDQRLDRALRALTGPMEAFHSAVARAVDEVTGELEARSAAVGGRSEDEALGPLAAGRIDPDRWAAVLARPEALDPDSAERMGEAARVLEELDDAGPDAFVCRMEEGAGLRDAVAHALGRLGRAFGAARTAELARTGRFRAELHGRYADAFPPTMWNRAERRIAPPLVVRLRGADLRPGALAEFLDGGQKLVLLVEGPAPPASLVRLMTPGALVLQSDDPADLEALEGFEGPAVAALFGSGAAVAHFVHDPRSGTTPADRLVLDDSPEEGDLRPVGPITVDQQAEELAQLRALAVAGAAATPSRNGAPADDDGDEDDVQPADRLAAWLLRQANLEDLGGGGA
ncbi:MAG: hypothetical protein GWO00_00735 [Gemmatimonadetes bacterium]|nr:hypothetical protein [Gemmatimonadota bacterium]NIP78238.1 hypothetical protein [Gemmatimonadota bacterium]NIR76960.1 hypothetical protein [Gemmatimonadota bacterium]NIU32378.1 hypothetical protein [Gemmatimonadota bacterium]NIU36881.1 hypothetical protein [Gemmatimonadota bacterium]